MARKRTAQEIDAEIAKLQKEREVAREAEKADVVARMKTAIDYYGITAADLGLRKVSANGAREPAKLAKPAKKVKTAPARIKWKDDAGHTWSGFGPKPRWFTEALASGKTEDELRAA